MLFCDRIIIANYSLEAMNAATTASVFCSIFQYGLIGIASIAEVFVGQNNGAKKYNKVASACWQMIWFSIFCFPIFLVIAKFSAPYILPTYHYNDFALPYFQWIMFILFLFGIQTAISSFFIGIGKVRVITFSTIVANILNIILSIALVFGIKGYFPSYGTKGAAIATGISQLFQIFILSLIFFKAKYREKYNTHKIVFDFKLIKKCLKIGFPTSAGHMIEITAWGLILYMMSNLGDQYITTMVVGQNIYAVIAFATSGLQKGVCTVSANLLGSKDYEKVKKAWKSAVKLLLIIALIVSIVLLIYPNYLIDVFLSKDITLAKNENLFFLIRITCVFLWFYLIFDGLTWITGGVLTSAGDTVFIMVMNALGAWFFALLPVYIFIVKMKGSPIFVWALMVFYGIMNSICFYIRYKYLNLSKNKISN